MKQKLSKVFILVALFFNLNGYGQSVSFDVKTNPTIDFTFNTITKYETGIIIHDAVVLDIIATGTQWDLYVGSSTAAPGTWDNIQYYGAVGNGTPSVGLLQVQFRNNSSTSKITGFVPMQALATTNLDIIGNHLSSPDPAVHCSDLSHVGTNTAGTYLVDPQCYRFKVDFRIVPGFSYRPGLYTAEVDIIIAADL